MRCKKSARLPSRTPAAFTSMASPSRVQPDPSSVVGTHGRRQRQDAAGGVRRPPRRDCAAGLGGAGSAARRCRPHRGRAGSAGAGKTALLHEYGSRILASDASSGLVVPVPLGPEDLDMPPLAMVRTIDQSFLDHDAQGTWRRRINRVLAKGMAVETWSSRP